MDCYASYFTNEKTYSKRLAYMSKVTWLINCIVRIPFPILLPKEVERFVSLKGALVYKQLP